MCRCPGDIADESGDIPNEVAISQSSGSKTISKYTVPNAKDDNDIQTYNPTLQFWLILFSCISPVKRPVMSMFVLLFFPAKANVTIKTWVPDIEGNFQKREFHVKDDKVHAELKSNFEVRCVVIFVL